MPEERMVTPAHHFDFMTRAIGPVVRTLQVPEQPVESRPARQSWWANLLPRRPRPGPVARQAPLEPVRYTIQAATARIQSAPATLGGKVVWGLSPTIRQKGHAANNTPSNLSITRENYSEWESMHDSEEHGSHLRPPKWHFSPADYGDHIKRWLGISHKLANKLIDEAEKEGQPQDITVLRIRRQEATNPDMPGVHRIEAALPWNPTPEELEARRPQLEAAIMKIVQEAHPHMAEQAQVTFHIDTVRERPFPATQEQEATHLIAVVRTRPNKPTSPALGPLHA